MVYIKHLVRFVITQQFYSYTVIPTELYRAKFNFRFSDVCCAVDIYVCGIENLIKPFMYFRFINIVSFQLKVCLVNKTSKYVKLGTS